MKLFLTLRRYARTQHLVMAIALGVLSGLLTTGILFLINEYLFKWGESARDKALLAFLILLPLVALSRYVSSLTLASLGLNTSYDLQIQLTRRILAAPLLKVQNQGAHRMLVALTDDIGALTDIMTNIPSFFINLAVVMGSLVYMGWLSPPMLGVVLGFMIFGMVAYSLPLREGIRRQRLSREIEDDLFEHFRGLTEGVKELKMRWERRKGFLDFMRKTAASYRDMRYATSRFFIGTTALGNFLLFSMLGILLFYMPTVLDGLDTSTVASYLVVLLYMMTPLQIILQDFPTLKRLLKSLRCKTCIYC